MAIMYAEHRRRPMSQLLMLLTVACSWFLVVFPLNGRYEKFDPAKANHAQVSKTPRPDQRSE